MSPANLQPFVEAICTRLLDQYVFANKARDMAALLRARLAAGAYQTLEGDALARALTDDLRTIGDDRHLSVLYRTDLAEHLEDAPTEVLMEGARQMNFGVRKVELMEGNVGYLDLRAFLPAEVASPTIQAAFVLLAHANALVLDLRQNGGGDPACVALVASFLFDHRTQLSDVWHRRGNRIEQFWTVPVPEPRFGGKRRIWVLTSTETFSGGEQLAYDLQALGRATLVGETTGGGAHPCELAQVEGNFGIVVPFARAVNPVTGKYWEGAGVKPDIEVPAGEALEKALGLAKRVLGGA